LFFLSHGHGHGRFICIIEIHDCTTSNLVQVDDGRLQQVKFAVRTHCHSHGAHTNSKVKFNQITIQKIQHFKAFAALMAGQTSFPGYFYRHTQKGKLFSLWKNWAKFVYVESKEENTLSSVHLNCEIIEGCETAFRGRPLLLFS
jgi:hypothetical protein